MNRFLFLMFLVTSVFAEQYVNLNTVTPGELALLPFFSTAENLRQEIHRMQDDKQEIESMPHFNSIAYRQGYDRQPRWERYYAIRYGIYLYTVPAVAWKNIIVHPESSFLRDQRMFKPFGTVLKFQENVFLVKMPDGGYVLILLDTLSTFVGNGVISFLEREIPAVLFSKKRLDMLCGVEQSKEFLNRLAEKFSYKFIETAEPVYFPQNTITVFIENTRQNTIITAGRYKMVFGKDKTINHVDNNINMALLKNVARFDGGIILGEFEQPLKHPKPVAQEKQPTKKQEKNQQRR